MANILSYSVSGKTNTVVLPKELTAKANLVLIAQARRVLQSLTHPRLAKTKNRSEINLTKKKLYRQKGTGGARHGAKSAPIFIGGGVAHGPRGIRRKLSLPTKMRNGAILSALGYMAKNAKLVLIEDTLKITKTKEAFMVLSKIKNDVPGRKKVLVLLKNESMAQAKFFTNIKGIAVKRFSALSVLDVLGSSVIVCEKELFFEPKNKSKKVSTKDKKEAIK